MVKLGNRQTPPLITYVGNEKGKQNGDDESMIANNPECYFDTAIRIACVPESREPVQHVLTVWCNFRNDFGQPRDFIDEVCKRRPGWRSLYLAFHNAIDAAERKFEPRER
jgi:hypothetical protein